MKILVKDFQMQIRRQICSSCGRVNDSRDEEGRVTSWFCFACRQVKDDMAKLKETRPSLSSLKKGDKIFDRYGAGFKRRGE
jgi:ribosomal protein L37AE/L43A